MNLIEKIKVFLALKKHDEKFEHTYLKFGEVTLVESGDVLKYDGEELVAGIPMGIVTAEGVLPAPDGKHKTTEGVVIVIEGGVGIVSEIIPAEVKTEEPQAQSSDAINKVAESIAKREIERTIQERERLFAEEKEKAINEVKVEFEAKLKTKEDELKAKNEIISKQTETIEKFNAEPSGTPTVEKFSLRKKPNSKWFVHALSESNKTN